MLLIFSPPGCQIKFVSNSNQTITLQIAAFKPFNSLSSEMYNLCQLYRQLSAIPFTHNFQMIYGAKVTCNVDCVYLSTIFNCLRKSLTSNQASSLEIGEWITPVPPANVDPLQYGDWFADRFESSDIADQNVKAIGVHDDDVRSFMRER